MVVDDEPYLRSFLKNLLEPRFAVETADGGAEALELARGRPDVILIDVIMPRMSGMDLCQRLRATQNPAKILMLTALDEAEIRRACLAVGANDLICKPFHPDELISRIEGLVDA